VSTNSKRVKERDHGGLITKRRCANRIPVADGAIGGVAQEIGGVFDKDGAVGRQFDASKDGLAGQVEKAVDGPSRPATEKK
jgi:hypothetical protein